MFTPILATITQAAAEHVAEHGAAAAEHMTFAQYILHSNVINMVFVFSFVVWVIQKADVAGMLKAKKQKVADAIAQAEEEKAKAQTNLQQAKENVKGLEEQVKQILVDAKNSAESIYGKIQADADKKVEEIDKNLKKMIDVEEKSAADEVVNSLSKEAYELATNKIKDALTDELHHKYINSFIDSLDETKVK
jgi:F0F1-type ATP synthase membrane subunit b/b'